MMVWRDIDVAYLPVPNTVETTLSNILPPVRLITTSFIIPLFRDGSILLANIRKRGLEVPGGHIEDGETPEEAARREILEEAQATILSLTPVGNQRLFSLGEMPANWKYPHPVSYQQFFAGLVDQQFDFAPTEECDVPVKCALEDAKQYLKGSHYLLYQEALKIFQIG